MTKKRIIIFLFYLGLIIRLGLIAFPGFKIDVDAWFSWANRLNQVGFDNFYSDQVWTNYTPGFLYILSSLGFIKELIGIPEGLFYLILKIPSIIAEMLLALFTFKLVNKKSHFWATILAGAILLNPIFIFNSSVWGQIDGFLTLFMFLSVYFLNGKKFITSSIFLGLSFLIKPQAIALLPVFVFYLCRDFSIKRIAKLFIPGILTIFILSLPFFPNNPFGLLQLFSKMLSDYSYTSLFAYNFWGAVGFWIKDSIIWNTLSYQCWGYLLYGIYLILIGYYYLKGKLSLYAFSTLAVLAFFFLPTRAHERYLYPGLVFLIILSGILKSKLIFFLSLVLSLINFLNLYYVYVYFNEIYLQLPKNLYNPLLYDSLAKGGKLLSILSTIIFVLISIVIFKHHDASEKD